MSRPHPIVTDLDDPSCPECFTRLKPVPAEFELTCLQCGFTVTEMVLVATKDCAPGTKVHRSGIVECPPGSLPPSFGRPDAVGFAELLKATVDDANDTMVRNEWDFYRANGWLKEGVSFEEFKTAWLEAVWAQEFGDQ